MESLRTKLLEAALLEGVCETLLTEGANIINKRVRENHNYN